MAEHREQVEQQITHAYREYAEACLDHDPIAAAVAMAQVDRLLEQIPRQR